MPQYALLLFEDEANWVNASPDEQLEMMREHGEFTEAVPSLGGKVVGGHGLQDTSTATSVRGDVVTDGPFVETKEAFGGCARLPSLRVGRGFASSPGLSRVRDAGEKRPRLADPRNAGGEARTKHVLAQSASWTSPTCVS